MEDNGSREVMLMVGGILSTVCSGSVVATGLIFYKTMLNRTHPFSNMIFIISLCDMLASIAMSFGFPARGDSHCHAQAFMLFFFFPASWLWTTALVYQLRCMMFYKKLKLSMFSLHCICWGIALIVSLVPLSENDYGEDDDLSGRTVCLLKSSRKQRKFWWLFGVFYGVLISCILLMSGWMISAYLQIQRMRGMAFTDFNERAIFKATRWYPLGLIITWSLSIAVTFMLGIYQDIRIDYIQAGEIAQTQYGTFLALIFFSNSKIVRYRWKELLCPSKPLSASQDDRQSSMDSLDPEGDKFSMNDSVAEGPRLSDVAQMLTFGYKSNSTRSGQLNSRASQASRASRSGPMLSNDSGDSNGTSGTSSSGGGKGGGEGVRPSDGRISTLIRDWLVSRTRKEVELGDTSSSSGGGRSSSSENSSVVGSDGASSTGAAGTGAGNHGSAGRKSPVVHSPLQPQPPVSSTGSPLLQSALKKARKERQDADMRNKSKAESDNSSVAAESSVVLEV